MDVTMNVKGWYGFVGLGQMGGNITKSVYVKEYPIMAANTAQSDLNGLDIPQKKPNITFWVDMAVARNVKRQNSCWQKIIVRILTCLSMRLKKGSRIVGLSSLWEVPAVVPEVQLCQL